MRNQRKERFSRFSKRHEKRGTEPHLHRKNRSRESGGALPTQEKPDFVVGIVSKTTFGWTLETTNRKDRNEYVLRNHAEAGQNEGRLVVAEVSGSTRHGRHEARIASQLGDPNDARNTSLIAIHANGIPSQFSSAALLEAGKAEPVDISGQSRKGGDDTKNYKRTDLRHLPLVTIDGPDARDFDDAVFAEPAPKGAWHLVVAIADVAHYVRPGSVLDDVAYERGNSTYFPDRVVPMLPERLSNDLCSLKPGVERACMAVHMWIDNAGKLTRWRFERGIMTSRARLTYEQVQAAMDGQPDEQASPLLKTVIKPLYGAYACLAQARLKRGTLELDLPERKVELNKDGTVRAITTRERLDSHKLIEEFMILANVAAAAQLENKGGICLYRIHDKPAEAKLDALRDFLGTLGINLAPSRQMHPRMLTRVLALAEGKPHANVVNEVMLRSQAQACYSPDNIGHFGLALAKYAHFTSPIRRYADLVVHRGLIRACNLGEDGLTEAEITRLEDIGNHVSMTERRSAMAERETIDRYAALYLAEKTGSVFSARVSGVTRFGLFVELDETGADGMIPFHALPNDRYAFNEKLHTITGRRTGRKYQLGMKLSVRLEEAAVLTGSLRFVLAENGESQASPERERQGKKTKRRHPGKASVKGQF